jgi:hypothetical protein
VKKEKSLSQVQQSKVEDEKNKALADNYILNRSYHYKRIVEENQIFWKNYHSDCSKAAESECLLKNGTYLTK